MRVLFNCCITVALQRQRDVWCVSRADDGPAAEIEFWRERNAALSFHHEQLHTPAAIRMVEVLEAAVSTTARSTDMGATLNRFKAKAEEMGQLVAEARDNEKFLATLERHFKNIRDGTLRCALDALGPTLGALRMVWVVSRRYGHDAAMGRLLERIAGDVARRARGAIDITTVFKLPIVGLERTATVRLAATLLRQWRTCYMTVREKIESGGRDARWEFDRKKLFERTEYMACVCDDMEGMIRTAAELHQFLGPQLKVVTGDAAGIDHVVSQGAVR